MYVGDVALLAIVQRAVTLIGEQVRKTQNSVQRRAQFVAPGGEKLILELACALRVFLCAHKELFRPLALGNVAQDTGEKEPPARPPAGQGKVYKKIRSLLSLRRELNCLANHVCFTALQRALE